ncbi:hypothetical protein LCGC14_2904890, partial [marine sediment metagenome]
MEIFERFRDLVEKELREVLSNYSLEGGPPHDLSILYGYQMGLCDQDGNFHDLPKGKYMRPTLCLAMCAALGGDVKSCLPAAASLELIHR